MKAPSPDSLKQIKDVSRPVITLAIGRVPDSERAYLGSSDSKVYAVAFSADGYRLATGDKVGHVVVWDVESGKQLTTCEAPGMYTWDPVQRLHSIGGIRSLAFSPDGTRLAVGGMGKVGNIDHLEG